MKIYVGTMFHYYLLRFQKSRFKFIFSLTLLCSGVRASNSDARAIPVLEGPPKPNLMLTSFLIGLLRNVPFTVQNKILVLDMFLGKSTNCNKTKSINWGKI